MKYRNTVEHLRICGYKTSKNLFPEILKHSQALHLGKENYHRNMSILIQMYKEKHGIAPFHIEFFRFDILTSFNITHSQVSFRISSVIQDIIYLIFPRFYISNLQGPFVSPKLFSFHHISWSTFFSVRHEIHLHKGGRCCNYAQNYSSTGTENTTHFLLGYNGIDSTSLALLEKSTSRIIVLSSTILITNSWIITTY